MLTEEQEAHPGTDVPIMSFGIYKGRPITDAKPSYLRWMLGDDVACPDHLREAARQILAGKRPTAPKPSPSNGNGNGHALLNAYGEWLRRRMSEGRWCQVPHEWAWRFGCTRALFLSFVLGWLRNKSDAQGWALVAEEMVAQHLGIGYDRQQNIIASFRRLKIIESEDRDDGRYVRVDLGALERLLSGEEDR
jgi:hypothetical protein